METEIAKLAREGLSNKEIAEKLGNKTERTVETHMRSILQKLNIKSRYEMKYL